MPNTGTLIKPGDDGAWARFTRRTDEPKLSWIEMRLDQEGIEHRRNGHSFHAPILEVQADRIADAWAIIEAPIGEIHIFTPGVITIDDLPDTHTFFLRDLLAQGGEVGRYKDGEVANFTPKPVEVGALDIETVNLPGVETPLAFYNVDSSNLSALAVAPIDAAMLRRYPLPDAALTQLIIYTRFKGGAHYRYFPHATATWEGLLDEMKQKARGIQEASVGSLFHHTVKVPAEEGETTCERLTDEGTWVTVPKKADRPKRGGAKS
jgi:hypothetical protein